MEITRERGYATIAARERMTIKILIRNTHKSSSRKSGQWSRLDPRVRGYELLTQVGKQMSFVPLEFLQVRAVHCYTSFIGRHLISRLGCPGLVVPNYHIQSSYPELPLLFQPSIAYGKCFDWEREGECVLGRCLLLTS